MEVCIHILVLLSILIVSSCQPVTEEGTFRLDEIPVVSFLGDHETSNYVMRGIGGGGAMTGLAISPYSSLWFVGTDMGTLFRSVDNGHDWFPINHLQATFSPDIEHAVSIGFSADPKVLFHALAGKDPRRSFDGGKSWQKIKIDLGETEYIRYWLGDSYRENEIYCATTNGFLKSCDKGASWERLGAFSTSAQGTFLDYKIEGESIIYHATAQGIFRSIDGGKSFSLFYQLPDHLNIRAFAAGRDKDGVTFAVLDDDGESACAWADQYQDEEGEDRIEETKLHCGYVWIGDKDGKFVRTQQMGGDFLRMAENNSSIVYVTGAKSWIRQYGTKVWRSDDRGSSWKLVLHQYNWDVTPYAPWPESKLEYSAPAIEQGWWDDGYESFVINRRNARVIAGSGQFFIHTSVDGGEHWQAPFTQFADTNPKKQGKKWKSVGLEVTTVYRFKFHPTNPKLGYAAMADVGGMVTEDGGNTFRISQVEYNSNYDYAFDPEDDNVVFAVSGSSHDYPEGWHAWPYKGKGGVYLSINKGRTWKRLTPDNEQFDRQFLTIDFDAERSLLVAGSHGDGVAISHDRGENWQYITKGMPTGAKVIPQVMIDHVNGDIYALLSGDAPQFTNREDTGIYRLSWGSDQWVLLRTTVHRPNDVEPQYQLWFYPTAFAVDFTDPMRQTLWLADYENNQNWLATGIWKSTDGGENWYRKLQYTHPTSITLDPTDGNKIYLNGRWQIEGTWGEGGIIYSTDGGDSWKKNREVPLQANGYNTTLDPNDPDKLFYTFFGDGLMAGPRPK